MGGTGYGEDREDKSTRDGGTAWTGVRPDRRTDEVTETDGETGRAGEPGNANGGPGITGGHRTASQANGSM